MRPILVGGIGNIFEGDDAFGVEVVRCLSARTLPADVDLIDFGIRGVDLAYALTNGYRIAILLDAAQRGETPGTLSVVEPEDKSNSEGVLPTAHDLDPETVLRCVSDHESACKTIVFVVCEPKTLGGDDGAMGLSEAVAEAIAPAADLVERLIASFLHKDSSLHSESKAKRSLQ
jgi:hydrogenase maturation protease